jgi:hypothetical protein
VRHHDTQSEWFVGKMPRRRRGAGRETTNLPIQADRAQRRSSSQLIIGDVVDFELAGVDLAQHQVRCAWAVYWGDTRELPFQPDCAQESPTVPKKVAPVI